MEQVSLFRDVAIITDYAQFFRLLHEYGAHERLSREFLCTRLGLSPSDASRVFRDARLLGLLDKQLCITSLGRQWERDVRQYARPTLETLREAALNVPLFAQTFRAFPDETNPVRIYELFRSATSPTTRDSDVGCARRRYLEGVFGMVLPRALPLGHSTPRAPAAPPTSLPHHDAAQRVPEAALARPVQLAAQYVALLEEFGMDEVRAVHAYLCREK